MHFYCYQSSSCLSCDYKPNSWVSREAAEETRPPHSLIFCVSREPLTLQIPPFNITSHDRPAIYFQVAHSHSVYEKWLRWPLWPHRAHIIVSLIEDAADNRHFEGKTELPAARSFEKEKEERTKGYARNDAAANNFSPPHLPPRLFTCGSQQRGAQMILDESTVVLAITETKLHWGTPFWAATNWCYCLACLTPPRFREGVWDSFKSVLLWICERFLHSPFCNQVWAFSSQVSKDSCALRKLLSTPALLLFARRGWFSP